MAILSKLYSWFLLVVAGVSGAYAAETLSLAAGKTSPTASIEQLSWLAGHWRGEALGGIVEEHWAPPSAGSMENSKRALSASADRSKRRRSRFLVRLKTSFAVDFGSL